MPRFARNVRTLTRFVACALAVGAATAGPLAGGLPARAAEPPGPKTLIGPELSEREKVLHVMNRLGYGPRPGEVDRAVAEGGWQAWAKQQVQNPDSIDDSACESFIAKRFPWTTKANIRDFHKAVPSVTRGKKEYETLEDQLPECVLMRATLSKRQFKEVISEFWRNHFCVDMGLGAENKSREWTSGHYEEQVIRKHAFGKFKNMLFDSARHPAMLEYLDNQVSRANAWNENYAREVMELHTVGADKGYGNQDVMELSKILTGWQFDTASYEFRFNEQKHQPGTKIWMGMKVAEGYDGGERALYILATAPATADFVCEKLCKYLVNDNPSPALVRRVATVWKQSDGDLPKVYWAILSSPEFLSRENYRAKFKTPFEFTVSALRATDAKVDDASALCKAIAKMGQPIYNCPDPTGYRFVAESWMDAGVLTTRWDFAWSLVRGSVPGVRIPGSFVEHFRSAGDGKVLEKMVEEVVGGDIGDREKKMSGDPDRLLSILLGSPSFQQK